MRKLLLISASLLAMVGQVQATDHIWILLGVSVQMGPEVIVRDTAKDSGTVPSFNGLPTYNTKADCQAAMHRAIQK